MKTLAVMLALTLSACATPTSSVVPLSDGLAKVTRQGGGASVRTSDLSTKGIRKASTWCENRMKAVRIIDVTEIQARSLGGSPEAEVLFKCE